MHHPIESREPKALKPHPLHRAHVPVPDKASPEWSAFIETVRNDARIRVPLLITKAGFVVDGWWRREAAVDLHLAEVPVQLCDDHEAALLIVETLTARKQMTRGAAVYLALGLLPEYASASEARRLKNKAAQRATTEQTIKVPSTGHLREEGSQRYLAERWGVGKGTIIQAETVRAKLHDLKEFTRWTGPGEGCLDAVIEKGQHAAVQARLRAEFEPLLFNGEKSLWTILQAVAGRLSTTLKPKIVQLEMVFGEKLDALFDGLLPKPAAAQAVIEEKLAGHDDLESLERIVRLGTGMAEAAQARIDTLTRQKSA